MGRTDWGMVILGGGALVGIAYVFFNWKTLCHNFGEGACNLGQTVSGAVGSITEGIYSPAGVRYSSDTVKSTRNASPSSVVKTPTYTYGSKSANPGTKATQAQQTAYIKPANTAARKTGSQSPCSGPNAKLYPFCSYYTDDFNSFSTITLNRMSVR